MIQKNCNRATFPRKEIRIFLSLKFLHPEHLAGKHHIRPIDLLHSRLQSLVASRHYETLKTMRSLATVHTGLSH